MYILYWFVAEFRAGRSPILIATDVAARGLGKMNVPPTGQLDRSKFGPYHRTGTRIDVRAPLDSSPLLWT